MNNYFECTVRYEKTSEEGKIVKVSEKYLVDAITFTEAEARITNEMKPFISGDYQVAAITRKKYSEIVNEEWSINAVDAEANKIMGRNNNQSTTADRWFDCKVNFITIDEEKGVEKKTPVMMLVHANSVNSAHDTLIHHMIETLADYTIERVAENKLIDVFRYSDK